MENNANFKILIVDENSSIHHDFKKILTTPGCNTLNEAGDDQQAISLPKFQINTAVNGLEGIQLIKQAIDKHEPYSLAFIDLQLPCSLDGVETIKCIWEMDRDLQIVICSTFADFTWENAINDLGRNDNLLLLKKPFDQVSVRQLAWTLTKKWQLLHEARNISQSVNKQVEERTSSLQRSLSLAKATLDSSDEGIVVISQNGKIIDHNQKFISMWNITQDECNKLTSGEMAMLMQEQLENAVEFSNWFSQLPRSDTPSAFEMIKLKDHKIYDCYTQPQQVNDHVVAQVLNFRDVTAQKKLELELKEKATHDALTGLPNRLLLANRLSEAMRASANNGLLTAVIYLDIDRFKLVNDSLSHSAGDEMLCAASLRLKSVLRDEDTLARVGGDEFVIILSNMRCVDDITEKASKIVNIFRQPFRISGRNLNTSTSIGICVYPNDGKTIEELLKNADIAMYDAKNSGGNTFKYYTRELNQKNIENLNMEIQLKEAIAKNELFLCYQPQFNISNNKLIAAEVLVRWNHPEKGILLPLDFIPLAESTGLIIELGKWVMRTACMQAKAWQTAGLATIRVSINLTSLQMKHQDLVADVRHILQETGLAPEYLELELTENIIVSSIEIIKTLTELKNIGVAIAIDNFGTGYSNLSHLKKLPLNKLKIDRSFISQITASEDDEIIIRAIIALAKNLNLEVLAEGVETQNQINFLRDQHCGEVQGYYYSKPLTEHEMEILLK